MRRLWLVLVALAALMLAAAPAAYAQEPTITTDITFVFGVKRMIDAESSRITPMKMKHHAAMIPLRASGAVTSRSTSCPLPSRHNLR